jgi:hypothetical protein
VVMELWDYPKIDAIALLSATGQLRTLRPAVQNCKGVHDTGREVWMSGWKRERRFNSDLTIKIFVLILGFMILGALLVYQSYLYAR